MYTKEMIFEELRDILITKFEVEESALTLDARLYEELDLDSIDAVDLVVALQNWTGKKVEPEDFKNARTIQDIVEAVYSLVRE